MMRWVSCQSGEMKWCKGEGNGCIVCAVLEGNGKGKRD